MNTGYALHRLSLLKQWRYDNFRLVFFLAVMLIFTAIIVWILPLFVQGNIQGAFTGMVCGLGVNFWLTCIARLRIDRLAQTHSIIPLLERYNYHKTTEGYYDLRVARYKKFKSQRIFVEQQDDVLTLTGPHNILKKITKHLDTMPSAL